MEHIGNLNLKSFPAERQVVSPERAELLEQIMKLEDDTDSPIAIGEVVKVRRNDAAGTVDDGWTVYGYEINEHNEMKRPYVAARVKKQGMEKLVAIGTLRMLNPTIN